MLLAILPVGISMNFMPGMSCSHRMKYTVSTTRSPKINDSGHKLHVEKYFGETQVSLFHKKIASWQRGRTVHEI